MTTTKEKGSREGATYMESEMRVSEKKQKKWGESFRNSIVWRASMILRHQTISVALSKSKNKTTKCCLRRKASQSVLFSLKGASNVE